MRKTLIVAVALLVLSPLTAAAQLLVGAWTLEQTEVTGGDNPGTFTGLAGLAVFTERHFSLMREEGTGPRPPLAGIVTDADRFAASSRFTANGGTYTVDRSTFTRHNSIAKHPNGMNLVRTIAIRFEGDDTIWFTYQPPGLNVTEKWVRVE